MISNEGEACSTDPGGQEASHLYPIFLSYLFFLGLFPLADDRICPDQFIWQPAQHCPVSGRPDLAWPCLLTPVHVSTVASLWGGDSSIIPHRLLLDVKAAIPVLHHPVSRKGEG